MHRACNVRTLVVMVAAALTLLLGSGQSQAAYDFTFTTQDFAQEVPFYGTCIFKTVIQNTGTVGDSVVFVQTTDVPGDWFADFCVKGRCYFATGTIWLAVGEKDTIDVEIFVGTAHAAGTTTLTATMKSAPSVTHSATYAGFAETPSIMLVDDDGGASYQTYMLNALTAAGYFARVWDTSTLGRPGATQLKSYWGVLWTTADGDASYLTTGDEADMASFLAGGGRLFFASQGFLSSRGGASNFITNYLHIAAWGMASDGLPAVGVPSDPISDGMSLSLAGGPFPADDLDNMTLSAGAAAIFSVDGAYPGTVGMRTMDTGHKAVFLSFPFEAVSTVAANPNNQNTLMSRVINWFEPPVAGVEGGPGAPGTPGAVTAGDRLVLNQNSPNPFGGATRISYLVRGGSDGAHLTVYNVRGEAVKTLVSGPVGSAETAVVWDGRDSRGAQVAPGVYFCELSAGGQSVLKKMVVAR